MIAMTLPLLLAATLIPADTKAKPTGLAPGSAKGTVTLDGKVVSLTNAYAAIEANPFDEAKDDIVIVLSEKPIGADVLKRQDLSDAPRNAQLTNYLVLKFRQKDTGRMGVFAGSWSVGNRTLAHTGLGDKTLQSSPDFDSKVEPVAVDKTRVEATVFTEKPEESLGHKYEYRVSFNAAVAPRRVEAVADSSNGKPLPPGGGDPGKAYLALNKAMLTGDLATLKKLAPAGQLPPDDQLKAMLPMMKEMAAKNVKIVSGFVAGDNATLNLEGETMGSTGKGTVQLTLTDGAWRVAKESWK